MVNQTASEISARATGALIFACFGALWIGLGAYVSHRLTVFVAAVIIAGLASLLFGCVWLLRRMEKEPKSAEDPAQKRVFNLVNGIQYGAIVLAVLLLPQFHGEAFVVPTIAGIVGLHLFPLARLFRYPLHYVTGALLVGWSMFCVFWVPRAILSSTAALGSGIILWGSAGSTLLLAARSARHITSHPIA